MINVVVVDGDLISRSEMFDEVDIDAAVARFDELSLPAPRLENAASQAYERLQSCLSARDWDSMGDVLLEDGYYSDEHRRVVNSGGLLSRQAVIESFRSATALGVTHMTSTVIATRGQRINLTRTRYWGREEGPDAFLAEILCVVEANADNRLAAVVVFDSDDIDAAVAELEERYLAGEAAPHAHTWSVIAGAYAAINRRELAATTPDYVSIDHRRGTTIAPGDLIAFIRASWDLDQESARHIETLHRLNNLGAVFTHQGFGTSQGGFAAEWRCVTILMVEGDMISRGELFDEADIDTALARFDELNRPAP
jgi:hypothetical protein